MQQGKQPIRTGHRIAFQFECSATRATGKGSGDAVPMAGWPPSTVTRATGMPNMRAPYRILKQEPPLPQRKLPYASSLARSAPSLYRAVFSGEYCRVHHALSDRLCSGAENGPEHGEPDLRKSLYF